MTQVIITILVVLALLGAVLWMLRGHFGRRFLHGSGPRAPRLGVIDQVPVDGKRRLVLVRRDQFEHLLLVGGPTDIVVEETIYRGVPLANYPRHEGVRPPAPSPSVPGAQSAASLRGAAPGALAAGEQPAPPHGDDSPADAPERKPEPTGPAAPPEADRPAASLPPAAVESIVEVPMSADRQSRAASFASRFQTGFARGSQPPRRTAPREPLAGAPKTAQPAPMSAAPPPRAASIAGAAPAAIPMEAPASVAAAPSPQPDSPPADADWITPAFAEAMEARQAEANDELAATIDAPPSEEMLPPPPPVEDHAAPSDPVEFAPRAARRSSQANLEQEMARLLGEIANKRSR